MIRNRGKASLSVCELRTLLLRVREKVGEKE